MLFEGKLASVVGFAQPRAVSVGLASFGKLPVEPKHEPSASENFGMRVVKDISLWGKFRMRSTESNEVCSKINKR